MSAAQRRVVCQLAFVQALGQRIVAEQQHWEPHMAANVLYAHASLGHGPQEIIQAVGILFGIVVPCFWHCRTTVQTASTARMTMYPSILQVASHMQQHASQYKESSLAHMLQGLVMLPVDDLPPNLVPLLYQVLNECITQWMYYSVDVLLSGRIYNLL